MIFDNRRISEITPQELIDLIGSQEENLWIDFKQQDYHRDPNDLEKHKREICKDVTAMANTEGGYILIGVSETNKIAHGFFTVPDANKVATSIRDTCLQFIDPRIPNLEVELSSFQWNNNEITLVIIHIPPSEMHPHSFKWGGSTNFVKRYNDVTREYPISELIETLLFRYHPPIMGQIDSKLATILANAQADRRSSISPADDPLEQTEVRNLLDLMRLRFEAVTSDQPYYRILAVPKELNPDAVDTRNENIRNILQNPPNIRRAGFGVTGILERDMVRSPDGINGSNMGSGEIFLLKNGFLEVRCPLLDTYFQRMRAESRISTPWLYPYVVCEFPVSFLKLVKRIYLESGIDSSVFIEQSYHNLNGFMLPKGNPSNIGFGTFQDESNAYTQSRPIISKRTVDPDFVPDHVAYELVREVYDCFGLDAQWIPAFDENGNFILK